MRNIPIIDTFRDMWWVAPPAPPISGAGASGYLTWGPTASAEHRDAHFAKARVLGKHHWVTSMHDVSFGPLTQAPACISGTPRAIWNPGCRHLARFTIIVVCGRLSAPLLCHCHPCDGSILTKRALILFRISDSFWSRSPCNASHVLHLASDRPSHVLSDVLGSCVGT